MVAADKLGYPFGSLVLMDIPWFQARCDNRRQIRIAKLSHLRNANPQALLEPSVRQPNRMGENASKRFIYAYFAENHALFAPIIAIRVSRRITRLAQAWRRD
jgi:hypothetical protein